ncbi:hypothetical protein [Arthrobacter sp. OAP107]|uniref:hypothetical protein n=1 Tax=Arthrobacter sp. OAP107 TaxID=3156445 RepID=UPI0033995D89
MHLSEKIAPRYEHLKKIADLLEWAGDLAGAEFLDEAREAYALARRFHRRADSLAVHPANAYTSK